MFKTVLDELWDQAFSKVMNPINMIERADSYIVEIRAAGIKKENIKIDVEGEVLVIKAESTVSDINRGGKVIYNQFTKDKIAKRIVFPAGVDFKSITAKLEDGILTITAPKTSDTTTIKVE